MWTHSSSFKIGGRLQDRPQNICSTVVEKHILKNSRSFLKQRGKLSSRRVVPIPLRHGTRVTSRSPPTVTSLSPSFRRCAHGRLKKRNCAWATVQRAYCFQVASQFSLAWCNCSPLVDPFLSCRTFELPRISGLAHGWQTARLRQSVPQPVVIADFSQHC